MNSRIKLIIVVSVVVVASILLLLLYMRSLQNWVEHYKMESKGRINYGRFLFGKIEPYDYLEFANSFSDEHANVIKPPFDIPLPMEIFYRLTFSESKGKTTINMTGQPIHANEEEQKGFMSINASMQQGFGATFNQLASYLDKLQSKF